MIKIQYLNEFAIQLLLENNIKKLPLNALELTSKSYNWIIIPYIEASLFFKSPKLRSYAASKSGFTIKGLSGDYVIFYNENLSFSERNIVIAHEIAHIVLYHSAVGLILGKSEDKSSESVQEQEADAFASYLVAPACVLSQANIFSSKSIYAATALSSSFLTDKIDEVANIKENGLSPIESKLCAQFRSYILKQKINRYKPFILIVIISILIFGITFALYNLNTSPANIHPFNQPINTIVYVSKTGSKFHLPTCPTIKNSILTEITIKDAVSRGYDACKRCNPLMN